MKKNLKFIVFLAIIAVQLQKTSAEEIPLTNKCNTWKYLNPEYLKKQTNRLQARKLKQCYAESPAKHFRVHYDTLGIDAVSHLDFNQNNIPDYVDTVCDVFDYVYQKEVEEMQFLRPRTDAFEENDQLYEIYLEELAVQGKGYYGECVPFQSYGQNKSYTYIVIDNNFSAEDSLTNSKGKKYQCFYTTGSEAVKVTAAHEFFHSIQMTYAGTIPSMCEINSVCMEIILYPEINDFLQYVNAMTKNINDFVFASNSHSQSFYSYGIFMYMLYQKYDFEIIRNLWNGISEGIRPYKSLDSCLGFLQSSLAEEWRDFCSWLYYSGSRSVADKYFHFANKINDLQPTDHLEFSQKENYVNYFEPYQLCFVRVIFPTKNLLITADTADFLLTNLNTDEIIKQPNSPPLIQYILSIDSKEFANSASIFDKKYWYSCTSQNEFADYLLFLHSGSVVRNISNAYPQPFCQNIDKKIYFPVPNFLNLGENVGIKIFDANLLEVAAIDSEVIINQRIRVAEFEPNLPPGVYIFAISVGGATETIGKFMIK